MDKEKAEKIVDFFNTVRDELMADDSCDKRSEDSIFYDALDQTCAEFTISAAEFNECVEVIRRGVYGKRVVDVLAECSPISTLIENLYLALNDDLSVLDKEKLARAYFIARQAYEFNLVDDKEVEANVKDIMNGGVKNGTDS